MIEIERLIDRKRVVYKVYEPKDQQVPAFKELSYENCVEGTWVSSTDGYVAQVIKVNGPYSRGWSSAYSVVLPYCRKWVRKGRPVKLLAAPFISGGKYYTSASGKGWIDQEVSKERTKRAVSAYATLMIESGGVLTAKQMDTLGRLYRPDQKNPRATFKRLLKHEKIKSMVKEELARIMSDNGLTPDSIIKTHMTIVQNALDSGQLSVAEKANAKFMDMLDMKPDKTNTQIEATVTWDHLLDEPDETEYVLTPRGRERLANGYSEEASVDEEQEDHLS